MTKHLPPVERPARRRTLKSALALAGVALGLPGCGGGMDDPARAQTLTGTPAPRRRGLGGVDSGGTGGKRSFFSAAVQGTAPLTAAGVRFDTQACSFVDADGQATEGTALAPGMTVWIDASAVTTVDGQAAAAALTLQLAEQLVGPVEALDTAAGTLRVQGQTVTVNATTLVDPSLASAWPLIVIGTRVRVWGQLDASAARTVATRIDVPAPGQRDVVRGVLGAVDAAAGMLSIGGLQAAAAPGADLPAGLTAGQVVRLTLVSGTPSPVWQTVREDALTLPDRDTVELEGRITAVESATRFALDGIPVNADGASVNVGGLPLPGQRATVQGASRNGVLLATQVEWQTDDGDAIVELQGVVQQVDLAASRFTLRQATVTWTASTRFEGGPPSALRRWRRLELKGRRLGNGVVEAFWVHLEL